MTPLGEGHKQPQLTQLLPREALLKSQDPNMLQDLLPKSFDVLLSGMFITEIHQNMLGDLSLHQISLGLLPASSGVLSSEKKETHIYVFQHTMLPSGAFVFTKPHPCNKPAK